MYIQTFAFICLTQYAIGEAQEICRYNALGPIAQELARRQEIHCPENERPRYHIIL